MSQEQKQQMVILPALKCPYCGAVDGYTDRQGIFHARLKAKSSRVIGDTRAMYYLCQVCDKKFRVLYALVWKNDAEAAKAVVMDDG